MELTGQSVARRNLTYVDSKRQKGGMKIYIRSESGATTSLVVDPYAKIYEVTNKAVDEGGASSCLRHLSFAGKELDDGRTLLDYGVKAETVLRLDSSSGRLQVQGLLLAANRGLRGPTAQPEIPIEETEIPAFVTIDDFKVKQLISRVTNNDPDLTGIHVWNEGVGGEGATGLAAAMQHNSYVLDLNLYNTGIGSDGAVALIRALCDNRRLQRLYFGSDDFGEDGLEALADMLCQNKALRALILRECNIGGLGAQVLAMALCQNRTLSRLDLWGNELGSQGCAALSTALGVNRSLATLCLSANGICSMGAEFLACALKRNCTLTRLDLGTNCIGERGSKVVANALLKNSTLSELCLHGNSIEDKGAEALAGALYVNSSLEKLDLRNNSISWKGAAALASALRHNTSLSKLVLHENQVADEGTKAFARSLSINSVMKELYLCNNCISDKGAEAFLGVANRTKSLFLLDLRGNAVDAGLEKKIRSLLRTKREKPMPGIMAPPELPELAPSDTNSVVIQGRKALENVSSSPDLNPVPIPYQYIEFSTDNFSNSVTEGNFGHVFRGRDSELELNLVVKTLSGTHQDAGGEMDSIIEREMEALTGFSHPNVARLSGYCLEKKSGKDGCLVYIVGSEGSLQDWLGCCKKRSRLHWTQRINIALELAVAVQSFVKSNNACFLDVQSSTISLSRDFSPVLVPELIGAGANREDVSSKMTQGKCDEEDIFSLGVVFSELLTGVQQHFSGNFNMYTDACAGDWVQGIQGDFTSLIRDCIAPNSGCCPLIEDVVYRLRILAAKALPYHYERKNHLAVLCSSPLVWKDEYGNLKPIKNPNVDSEKRLLLSCLRGSNQDISVTFDVATFERLQMTVASRARCLHFSGHGYPDRILLEDQSGGADFLDGSVLQDCVHVEPCQFAFLSACFSEYLGEALVRAGVPHVVCCEHDSALRDEAAIEFTHIFYFSAFRGFTIGDAFEKGKKLVNVKYGEAEADKFLLLPESGNHGVPLFDGEMRGEFKHVERENFIPSITNCTFPQQTDTYKLLQLVLSRRLVTVVGGKDSERSSLVSAVCRFINERKSIFLNIQSIHYIQQKNRTTKTQQESSFIKALHCRLLTERGKEKKELRSVRKNLADGVVNALIGSPSLIVFDECCTDSELTGFIGEMLAVTGTVRFLVTCQEALNNGVEECIFPVGAL